MTDEPIDLDAPPPAARYAALEAGHHVITGLNADTVAGAATTITRERYAADLEALADQLATELADDPDLELSQAGAHAVATFVLAATGPGLVALGALAAARTIIGQYVRTVDATLDLELAVRQPPPPDR